MSDLTQRVEQLQKELDELREEAKNLKIPQVRVEPCQLYFGEHLWGNAVDYKRILLMMGGRIHIFGCDGKYISCSPVEKSPFLGEETEIDSLTYVFKRKLSIDEREI